MVFNQDTVLVKARLTRVYIVVSVSRPEISPLQTLSLSARLMEHLLTQHALTYNYPPWSPYPEQVIDYTEDLYNASHHHVNGEQGSYQVCKVRQGHQTRS
jgi:hypothetical protein